MASGQFAGCSWVSESRQCSWERPCPALCWAPWAWGGQGRVSADHLHLQGARGGWGGDSAVGTMLPFLVERSLTRLLSKCKH